MKKTLSIAVFAITLLIGVAVTTNNALAVTGDTCMTGGRSGTENASGVCVTIGGSGCNILVNNLMISPYNKNLSSEKIGPIAYLTVNWMTNQFTKGFVLVEDELGYTYSYDDEYEPEQKVTYNTVKFFLYPGTYKITRVSYNQKGEVRDIPQTVVID